MTISERAERILVATAAAAVLGACAGTPAAVSLLHNNGPIGKQAGLRERLNWNRKCEIMVLASNEPEKAHYLQSRCRR